MNLSLNLKSGIQKLAGFLFAFVPAITLLGQGVTIGTNNPPHPSAILDLQTSQHGFALPRLSESERNAIQSPLNGLQIYNTDNNCLEIYFPNSGWRPIVCDCNAFPNAQFSIPQNAEINQSIPFSALPDNMTYSWSFEQGNPATGNQKSENVTWANPGSYAIELSIIDSAGCRASHLDTIHINPCFAFTQNFSSCGETGRTGPTQAQCDLTYGPGVVQVSNGIQLWTVPNTGTYRLEVAGAGFSASNPGAILQANLTLTAGTQLRILVGQQGGGGNSRMGSGGTFITTSTNQPLLIAGGGGGWSGSGSDARMFGTTQTCGQSATGTGGCAGQGGVGNTNAGGGGGLLTDGGGAPTDGGLSFLNGGFGGTDLDGGGFGGGGAYSHVSSAGGGGGYSGGGRMYNSAFIGAGGGGSFVSNLATNAATSDGLYDGSPNFAGSPIQNLSSYHVGNGYATITRVCN